MKKFYFLFALGLLLFLTPPAFSQEVVPEGKIAKEYSGKPFVSREKLSDTLLESNEGGDERVQTFVENLSDEQVFALNRSLNNAVKSGQNIDFDLDLLETIVDENYDKRQINALTKALEEEAKFLAKYEETGDPKFIEKAEQKKEKFLAKIDKFGEKDSSEEVTESSSFDGRLEKFKRPGKAERFEKAQRREKNERPEKAERPDRGKRPERVDRPEKAQRPARPDNSGRGSRD